MTVPFASGHTTQHCLGFTYNLEQRISEHRSGEGARLCAVAKQRGVGFVVAREWDGERPLEQHLKSLKNGKRLCPFCKSNQKVTMQLAEYPNRIAALQRKLLKQEQTIRRKQWNLDRVMRSIEQAIALDSDLKNDQQRKAKRLELMDSDEYRTVLEALEAAEDKRALLKIDLELLRNRFTVFKLEVNAAYREIQLSNFLPIEPEELVGQNVA